MEPKIRAIYEEHKGRYGYRRITAALSNSMAEPVNHKCVQRLMQKMGLRAVIRAKKRSRHVSGMSDEQVPNVLERDFCATAPNQKWATDVTEFNVHGNKLYLSACMDLYNGEIVAHKMARRPVYELVASTLQEALSRTECTAGLIVHSDQGWHYKMQPYRAMLAQRGVKQSMSRKGNCFDNAIIENFFGILKSELFYLKKYNSVTQLKQEIIEYIEYYNNDRIKLNLKGNTINFFENTNSSNYQTILDASDPVNGDATLALRGQVGSGAFIELFDQNELDNLRSKNWLINDAILTINIKDLGQTNASRIYLYDASNNSFLFDYFGDSSTSTDKKMNKFTFGGILEEDTDTNDKKYRIRLTSHIRNLLNTDVDELAENVLLGLVVTEDINTATLMSIKNTAIFGNELIPTSSIMGPSGTVLYGTNVSATDIAKKMKLDIYYTEPK